MTGLHPAVVAALPTALAWLYDTVQPDDAVLSHLGQALPVPEANRLLLLVPAATDELPVLVLDVARTERDPSTDEPRDPLGPGELDELANAVAALGRPVVDRWNGHPAVTGSLRLLDWAHPTLRAAVARYRAGCPAHRTVFCGSLQRGVGPEPLPSCQEWRAGFGRVVPPAIVGAS